MPRRDRGSLGRTRTVSVVKAREAGYSGTAPMRPRFFYALPQRTDPFGGRPPEDAGIIHEALTSPPVDMLRSQSHTCTCTLSSVAGFVRRRVPLCGNLIPNRSLPYMNIKGCGHSFLPSGETNDSRTAPLYHLAAYGDISGRKKRECAASACSCKGLQTEKPLPSRSLTESPNHTDYKSRPDSFMAGGISRKAVAGQRSRAQRICPLFSPVNRIPLRHFVQFFHNHFRLVVRPERPGDIHVATGLVFVLPGVPCLFQR